MLLSGLGEGVIESSRRFVIAKSPAPTEAGLAGALPAGAGASSSDHCAVSPWYHGVFRMADAGIRVVMVSCVIDSSFAGGSQGSKGASNDCPAPTGPLLIYRRMGINLSPNPLLDLQQVNCRPLGLSAPPHHTSQPLRISLLVCLFHCTGCAYVFSVDG